MSYFSTHTPELNEPDRTFPRFYVKAVPNAARSKVEGKPCFDNVEYVEITIPGDRDSTWDGRVQEKHKLRWPRQYEAFTLEREQVADGTPLEAWPRLTPADVAELKHQRIMTIEQVAGLSDEILMRSIPRGGHDLREAAKRWVAQTAGVAPMEALAAKNAELEDKLAVQAEELAELKQLLAAHTASTKPPKPKD